MTKATSIIPIRVRLSPTGLMRIRRTKTQQGKINVLGYAIGESHAGRCYVVRWDGRATGESVAKQFLEVTS